jgi:uncharacterized Ntn-hydrolase superfamily protein
MFEGEPMTERRQLIRGVQRRRRILLIKRIPPIPPALSFARVLSVVVIALGLLVPSVHASQPATSQTVATFSIVGVDPANGDLGVAVESRFFAVGSVVPWAEAGVGAVATQASGNTTFGPKGLTMLRLGMPAGDVLKNLLATDPGRERRQVGIVDAAGNTASFTGKECMSWAGGITGKNWTAQGNILVGQDTVTAMGRAFEATKGELAERLMAALEAGQAAGGDSRGQQSAAILVVRQGGGYQGLNDRYIDLRVDDAKEPIVELRRLLGISLANARVQHAYVLTDQERYAEALTEIGRAIAARPADKELLYHRACMLARAGNKEEALLELETALRAVPWLSTQAATDSDLAPLRDDARFKALVPAQAAPNANPAPR